MELEKLTKVLNSINNNHNHKIVIDTDLSWSYVYKAVDVLEKTGFATKTKLNKKTILINLTNNGLKLKNILNKLVRGISK